MLIAAVECGDGTTFVSRSASRGRFSGANGWTDVDNIGDETVILVVVDVLKITNHIKNYHA